jgi:hypothetical protein
MRKGAETCHGDNFRRLVSNSGLFKLEYMRKKKPIPEIAEAVRLWMPDASEEEQKQATVNLRNYLAVIYRIVLRLEAEGRLGKSRDKISIDDRVESPNE